MYGKMKEYLQHELAEIEAAGLYKRERIIASPQRAEIEVAGRKVLNFCANNYLGLSDNPRLIEAAKKYKIHGTGITLSHEQYAEFQRRIKEQGLEDYLTVELMDYRDLPKKEYQFDRVVSVGMLEHVGRDNYQLFLDCVEKVLKPGGLFLLHFISALKEHPGDPWVKKYIFPGGTVPSLREILNHMAEDNFHTLDIENLRLHYNKTLLHWEKNFRDNIEKEKTMFDEEFLRMWDLYLSACAATFHNGIIDLHQILMTKGINNDLPMTRWY